MFKNMPIIFKSQRFVPMKLNDFTVLYNYNLFYQDIQSDISFHASLVFPESCKVVVRNIPASIDSESLELFFENKKKVGCDLHVDKVEVTGTQAVVDFSSEDGKTSN